MSEICHETKIRVRYADTDQMRVVYHGRYFEYFEQARGDMLREMGLPYSELEKRGILLPVIEASAKYRQSAFYEDLLTVQTILREPPVARLRLEYKVLREGDAEPLVEGFTVHSFLNAETRRPTRAPAQLIQLIQDSLSRP